MSLYLQATVGAGRYLLEAARIIEVRPIAGTADAATWQGEGLRRIDLRELFGENGGGPGCCVLVAQTAGATVALFVDAVEGLVEIGHAEWRPLPPIGPLAQLIDAVSTRLAQGHPMLRVRGERALAAAFGRDTTAGVARG